jgi:hypothetical protein
MKDYNNSCNCLLKKKELPNKLMALFKNFDVVGPIEINFKNRRSSVDAIVLNGDTEPLLGAIPKEDMPARLPSIS